MPQTQQEDWSTAFPSTENAAPPSVHNAPVQNADDWSTAFPQSTRTQTQPAQEDWSTAFPPSRAFTSSTQDWSTAFTGSESNAPWYSRTWNWLNTPLTVSLLGWQPHRDGATGAEAGAEEFASGLTSPLNLGLTALTMGGAPLLESMGVKLAGEAALPAIRTIGKLAKVGFTAQMVGGLAEEYPEFQTAIKNGDSDRALEVGTRLALGGALAFHGAREVGKDFGFVERGPRANTGVDAARGQREAVAQKVYQSAREVRSEVLSRVGEDRRGAVQLYAEAGGDPLKLDAWKSRIDGATNIDPKLQQKVSTLLDAAKNLQPLEVEAAGKLRAYYDDLGQRGVDAGILDGEKLGRYVARSRWTTEPVEAERLAAAKESLQQQSGRVNHLQRRVFEDTVTGILARYTPKSLDAADIAADYGASFARELGNKAYVERALTERGSDGRPLAVRVADGRAELPADRFVYRSRDLGETGVPAESHSQATASLGEAQRYLQSRGKITGQPQELVRIDLNKLAPGDYQRLPGPNGNDWIKFTNPAPESAVEVAEDGEFPNDIRNTDDYSHVASPHSKGVEFHPEILRQAKLVLAPERSVLADIPGAKQLLKLSTLAKETKLIGGFHWSQIGLRNLMSGINPFATEEINLSDPMQAKMLSAGGLQLASPRENAFTEESEAGGGGLLAKVPGIGRFLKVTNDRLFGPGGYIDRSKMSAALNFAERLKKAQPDMDEATRMRYAGEMANNRFGGQNWTAMEKNQTYRDLMRGVFLAPDFLISNVKDALSAFGPVGRLTRFDIARIVAFNFAAARVGNLLVNGAPHFEQPFAVVSPDGKEAYSVRTMPADIFGGLADPRRFVGNRMSPFLNVAQEAVEGRDKLGRKRSTQEQIMDLFGQFVPLPVNAAYQLATGGSVADFRPADSALTSIGLSATKNYSPAERKALELASHYSVSSESVPAAQLDKLHTVMRVEDDIRAGNVTLDDAQAALQAGQISRQDFQNIRRIAQDQQNFPQTARLRAQIRRLPLAAALDVWRLADDSERKDLLPLLHAKAQAWQRNAAKNTTPRQRAEMMMRLAALASDAEKLGSPTSADWSKAALSGLQDSMSRNATPGLTPLPQ